MTPEYTSTGQLLLPERYESWMFVGSNLSMVYRHDLPAMTTEEAARADREEFHNIYINNEAYTHFAKTGEFPDPTMLVMERFVAAEKGPKGILAKGQFNGARSGVEVAVKDSKRPRSSTLWAYYVFPSNPSAGRPTARARPDRDCYQCHNDHASVDNVWVQFYPKLRDNRNSSGKK